MNARRNDRKGLAWVRVIMTLMRFDNDKYDTFNLRSMRYLRICAKLSLTLKHSALPANEWEHLLQLISNIGVCIFQFYFEIRAFLKKVCKNLLFIRNKIYNQIRSSLSTFSQKIFADFQTRSSLFLVNEIKAQLDDTKIVWEKNFDIALISL